jgi:hydroxymethylpyrimidine/phosphomethylpyrimidine kinase
MFAKKENAAKFHAQPILTIAGSDCSGGAGIQADLKTIAAHYYYGMSVITALTAQNTLGVTAVHDVPPEFVAAQLDAVFTDIPPDAVKIGMVSNAAIIKTVAEKLRFYKAKNIVADPVMVATSGSSLLSDDSVNALVTELLPLAKVITPNIPEAEKLSGIKIGSHLDMETAAKIIASKTSGAVLVKGGHSADNADDLLYADGVSTWIKGKRVNNPNTHGTGCVLSAAIACNLAAVPKLSLCESVVGAKGFVTRALNRGLDIGKGNGPLWLSF